MASPYENISMAVFCDFENVALGVRDAKYEKFDMKRVLERLLLKGSIVVKKAYCDWDRYKEFKATMHEANFELIEIPHIRQSGKNSADIRLVVDALDLCYTKSHVNTFVIISGDSDFSPLVSKLRENAKQVIGVGVKKSTSDLLIANCDEFIFYDDLVRESQRPAAKRAAKEQQAAARQLPGEEQRRKEELEARKSEAIETAVDTFDALVSERGDSGKIWASALKQAIKRRKPGFNESYYGFRAFGNLLDEAQARGLLELGRDEKSGTFVYRSGGVKTASEPAMEQAPTTPALADEVPAPMEDLAPKPAHQRRRGSRRLPAGKKAEIPGVEIQAPETASLVTQHPAEPEDKVPEMTATENPSPGPIDLDTPAQPAITASEPDQETAGAPAPRPPSPQETPADKKTKAQKSASRKPSLTGRHPRKPKSLPDAA